MKILIAFKSVPVVDAEARGAVPSQNAKREINPFCAIALEESICLREQGIASEVTGVTIGGQEVEEQARSALAMGCDRVLHVVDSRQLDPLCLAKLLQAVVQREEPQLVMLGKQAVDDDCNQVGQMLAGLLGWSQATFISKIEFTEDRTHVTCTRDTDAGLEVISARLPIVVTTDLRLNEPRYVSLPGLIKARRNPLETVTARELEVKVEPMTRLLQVAAMPARPAGQRVASVDELIDRLRNEARLF